jgi:hypothetical protein
MPKDEKPEIEADKTEDADKTVETPKPEKAEKMVPQAQVDKLMADQRRKHREDFDALKAEFTEYKSSVEAREKEANDAAEKKVTELRKDLPEGVIRLLDKLTPVEQLEWLSDPANTIEKKHIEPLPRERGDHGAPPRVPVIV